MRVKAVFLAWMYSLALTARAQEFAVSHSRLKTVFDGAPLQAMAVPLTPVDGFTAERGALKVRNEVPAPAVEKKKERRSVSERLGRSFTGIFTALVNLIKLAIFAPLSIASNIVEGIGAGIKAFAEGNVWNMIIWPAKTAVNAAWNTVIAGLNFANAASDPLWRLYQRWDSPDISVDLIGEGSRMRTLVTGGPLSHISKLGDNPGAHGFVLSSAFIQNNTPLSNETLAHEFVHTLQFQNSLLIDLLGQRLSEGNEKAGAWIENGKITHIPLAKPVFHKDGSVSPNITQYIYEGQNLGKIDTKKRHWIAGTLEKEAEFKAVDLKKKMWRAGGN